MGSYSTLDLRCEYLQDGNGNHTVRFNSFWNGIPIGPEKTPFYIVASSQIMIRGNQTYVEVRPIKFFGEDGMAKVGLTFDYEVGADISYTIEPYVPMGDLLDYTTPMNEELN